MKFLDIAKMIASDNKEFKNMHGCVIAKGNKLVSTGINCRRTRIKKYNYDHLECHAELSAIMRVKPKCILWGDTICC
jgi:deoxycytidylate deaminase